MDGSQICDIAFTFDCYKGWKFSEGSKLSAFVCARLVEDENAREQVN